MAIIKIYRNGITAQVRQQTVRVLKVYDHPVPAGIQESIFSEKGSLIVGTGPNSYTEFPPGTVGQYLTPDPSSPTGLKYETPSVVVQDATNYAINGGFDFAQEQTPGTLTTIADGDYGPDQWKSYRENADLQYRRVDGSGVSGLNSPYYGEYKKITNAGKILICQPLEYIETIRFRGNVVSFQLKLISNSGRKIKIAVAELQSGGVADTIPAVVSAWNVDTVDPTLGANLAFISTPVECNVTTAFQTFIFSGVVPDTSKNIILVIWSDADLAANDTIGIAEAGIRFGTTIRSWTPRSPTLELLLCSRYAYLHSEGSAGRAETTTKSDNGVTFPVKMRIAPTSLKVMGTIKFRDITANTFRTATGTNTCTLSHVSNDGAYIEFSSTTWSANFTAGNMTILTCDSDNGILFKARL